MREFKKILLMTAVAVTIISSATCIQYDVYGNSGAAVSSKQSNNTAKKSTGKKTQKNTQNKAKKQTQNQMGAYPAASAVTSDAMHAYVQSVIAQVTTPDMTNDQKLAASYLYVLDHMNYKRSTAPGVGTMAKDYALEAFFTGQGNCYRYASMFAYMAKELGYDASIHAGECTSSHGGMTPHSWVVINHPDGRVLIYDGSFGDSAKGSKNYFGITEGEHSRKLVTREIWQVIF